MAQSERFYFWRGYYDALRKLPSDAQRGRLVLAICAFAFDGIEPDLDDDLMLSLAWSLVADGTRESVRKGIEQSARGQMGGRPSGTKKSGVKTTAKSTAKSGVKSTAESERKRREEKGREPSPHKGGGEGSALAPDGAAPHPDKVIPDMLPDGSTVLPNGIVIPPQRDD